MRGTLIKCILALVAVHGVGGPVHEIARVSDTGVIGSNNSAVPPHLGPAAKSVFVGDSSLTRAEFLGNHRP